MIIHSVVPNSLHPHGLQPPKLLHPWDFPGKNTGMDCHFLLQGIFLTQRSNLLGLLHCRLIPYPLSQGRWNGFNPQYHKKSNVLKNKFLCKTSYHCCLQKFLASLNVRLLLLQVCGPDDIIHLKRKNLYSTWSTYLSLDVKFVFLAIVMVENQGIRNSSFWLGLIGPNYIWPWWELGQDARWVR